MSAAHSIMSIEAGRPPSHQDRRAIESRINLSGLHSTAVRLLMTIAELAGFGRNPRGCFATTATLLKVLGDPVKPRQAGNLLKQLENEGWIIVLRVGDSQSRFARRHIFLGPRCLNDPTSAPSNSMTVHLAIPYRAPSSLVPALPPTGEESRTTTTEPRGLSSFSSRPHPEPPGATTSQSSHAVPPTPPPIALSEFDLAVLNAHAERFAALNLPGLASKDAAKAKIISLRCKLPGWSPAEILEWLAGALGDAENKANGKNPVDTWGWFERPMTRSPHDKVYTPGVRKRPAPLPAPPVHRRSDPVPKPPGSMDPDELARKIADAREGVRAAEEQLGAASPEMKPAFQRMLNVARSDLAELEETSRLPDGLNHDIIDMLTYDQ